MNAPPVPPSPAVGVLQSIEANLSRCLIERDDEISAMMRCAVANEHLLLVGPPGTAKSLLCSSLAKSFKDVQSFDVLLTKFSMPEDVFGAIDIQELKAGRYVRNTKGYLPTVHLGFIDEVFKASTAIINSLLTIMNERVYDNGGDRIECPLRMLIGASNEWPASEELGAAFDRFLVRRIVKPVSHKRLEDLMFADLPTPSPVASIAQLDEAHTKAMAIPFSDDAKAKMFEILEALGNEGITVGDRRKRKAVKIARAEAFLSFATEVQPEHLSPLADVLWEDPTEQQPKCSEIVNRIANPKVAAVNKMLSEIDDLLDGIKKDQHNTDRRRSAIEKLVDIRTKCEAIGSRKALQVAKYAREQWQILTAANLHLGNHVAKLHSR